MCSSVLDMPRELQDVARDGERDPSDGAAPGAGILDGGDEMGMDVHVTVARQDWNPLTFVAPLPLTCGQRPGLYCNIYSNTSLQ